MANSTDLKRVLTALFGFLFFCVGAFAPPRAAADRCVTPPAGLISWWRAESNAADVLNVNNGTLEGGVTFAAGEVGQAFSFNGASDVQVPDSPSLDFASNSPMTIELWAYRTGAETSMYLIGKRDADCGSVQYQIGFDPYNGMAFDAGDGSVATGIQMPMTTWIHLAATFDGANTFEFYTNGTLAATGNGNLGPTNSGPLRIGNSSVCGGFTGLIDEVSLYNDALSAATIQSIYAAGISGKCLSPPTIATQPQSQTVLAGETVTFSVAANGGIPPYNYQWQINGSNISGATADTVVLTGVQSNQVGSYSVVVGDAGGSVLSSNATLRVLAPVPDTVVVFDQAGLLSGLANGGNVKFAGNGTIVLSQTVVISQGTTLDGSGHDVTISGSNSVRVFTVNSGVHFALESLTIVDGLDGATNNAGAAAGGLYNDNGRVDVVQCAFIGNGAVGNNGGSASGGAIYNNLGLLNITNSIFLNNSATGGEIPYEGPVGGNSYGGAIYVNGGTMNLVGSTFQGNSSVGGYGGYSPAGTGFGGSVHNGGGILNVVGTTFTGNSCSSGYGGGGGSLGGALSTSAGNVTVINGGFYNNNAVSPTIYNYAFASLTAGTAFGGGIYQADGTLNLIATTLATNYATGGSVLSYGSSASGCGGGLFSAGTLNATNCNFYGNHATGGEQSGSPDAYGGSGAYGGAIFNQNTANLIDTSLSDNEAIGIAGNGGGILNSNVLLLLGCTLSQNDCVGAYANAYGGGIYNLGVCFATNDTVFGNSASAPGGSANGGGYFNQGGVVTLAYVTISSNSADGSLGVGGGINATNGSLLLLDSIVADNPSGSDFYASFGAITDGGDNISSDISFPFSAPGSMNNTDPELGVLGNYGGPTQTIPLLMGSPAIDAGGAGGCPATDQRGVPRPFGGACDIGAFEYVPSFSIQGQVQSYAPTGTITVSAGDFSTEANSQGNYVLNNLAAGTYSVTPSSSNPGIVFTPAAQTIKVGPNATNVNFVAAPLINSLSVGGYSNSVLQVLFSGTNGQNEVVETSFDLINWIPISTNVVVTNGILPFLLTNGLGQAGQFVRTRSD